MIVPVCCRQCRNFIPDPIGSGAGIGKCTEYEAYKAKGPSQKALKDALHRLGNRDDDGDLFWGGEVADRHCEKYKAK